jgi:hypothetical protein
MLSLVSNFETDYFTQKEIELLLDCFSLETKGKGRNETSGKLIDTKRHLKKKGTMVTSNAFYAVGNSPKTRLGKNGSIV